MCLAYVYLSKYVHVRAWVGPAPWLSVIWSWEQAGRDEAMGLLSIADRNT